MIVSQQGWRMIKTTQYRKTLVAVDTALSLVPTGNYFPDEAVLGVRLDHFQTLLTAVVTLRPTRASIQMKLWVADKRPHSSFSCRYVNRFAPERLCASDDPLTAIQEVRAYGRNDAKGNHPNQQSDKDNAQKVYGCHKSPPGNPQSQCFLEESHWQDWPACIQFVCPRGDCAVSLITGKCD